MKLTAFRIENYRCIQDSGWVEIDDIAVVVGKNESGKTSLLKALWKFKPFHDVGYDLSREWPRGRRKEMSEEKVVSTVRFQLSSEEVALVEAIHESAKGITGVEIKRNYKGHYRYTFLPRNPADEHGIEWVVSLVDRKLGQNLPGGLSQHFMGQYCAALKTLLEDVRANGGSKRALAKLPEFKNRFPSFVHPQNPQHQQDHNNIPPLNQVVDDTVKEISATPLRLVIDAVHERLPTFIYMDDYKMFKGAAQLNDVKQRRDSKRTSPEDETLIQIMEMAGLDLDQEVRKGGEEDREQRILDMNDASQTLTTLIADRWSQKQCGTPGKMD